MKPQNGRLHTLMDYEMAKNEETGLLYSEGDTPGRVELTHGTPARG